MRLEYYLSDLLGESLEEVKRKVVCKQPFTGYRQTKITENHYLTCEERGIGFVFNKDYFLDAVHLFSGTRDGISRFNGELPLQLHFDDPINHIESKIMHQKFDSGRGEELPFLGRTNPWRKYYFENCSLHLEFNSSQTIELITLGLEAH